MPNGLSEKTFTWTPTHTVAVIVFILIFLTGVFYYSRSFFLGGSPALKLDVPKEGELIIGNSVIVKGRLKRGDIVVVNGDKVLLKADNSFETLIDCRPGDNVILVEASNPGGDKEQLTRRFICQEP